MLNVIAILTKMKKKCTILLTEFKGIFDLLIFFVKIKSQISVYFIDIVAVELLVIYKILK